MKAAFKCDVGRKREANEDWLQVDEKCGLAILADGMGGHQAGEVASRLAVDEAYDYLKERLDQAHAQEDISKLLVEAVLKAHDAIKEKPKTDPNLMGMGITLVEMVIKDGRQPTSVMWVTAWPTTSETGYNRLPKIKPSGITLSSTT